MDGMKGALPDTWRLSGMPRISRTVSPMLFETTEKSYGKCGRRPADWAKEFEMKFGSVPDGTLLL
jgi:hypothetical protein